MPDWPRHPVINEVHTWVWLHELGGIGLGDVPAEAWDRVAVPGVDAIWLMGVWERSPAGIAIARADAELMGSFRDALPDATDDDVVGSPYCVRRYVVDERLGGPEGLAAARAELAARGVRLLLDFVPNHVAPDHPWVEAHPERFVHEHDGTIALARDPYFPPWKDVVQLDAFDPGMRAAAVETLVDIGSQCDGVRCDMAMLLLNEVFARTWGDRVGPPPPEEFWPEVIPAVHAEHPEMLFVAEVYWGLEPVMLDHGFDHVYDKVLYDRFEHGGPWAIREHLWADPAYQQRMLRFLENHDEPRVAATLEPRAARAATVALATLPGATMWHEGQFDGRRTRVPVFLGRRPEEPLDDELRAFHLAVVAAATRVRRGEWRLLGTRGWPDNDSHSRLLAWCWDAGPDARSLVVLNLSAGAAQAMVELPWELTDATLTDVLDATTYERSGRELYVDLGPWSWHVFTIG